MDITAYFVETYGLEQDDKLTMNIELWVKACHMLTKDYHLTDEQQAIIDLLYVGCQLSSAPLFLIPPSAMLASEHVRDFSVSFASLVKDAEDAGYCGQFRRLLEIFGYRNGALARIIVR
ncbi:MAG: hypothetical protein NC548_32330 [Lachnospiraceae bacterium]|nr:hypothetical protein [Lachnospiraceae bacterium]